MKKYTSGIVLFTIGIVCFVIKGMIGSRIDADGTLHEAFGLIPIGYLFILLGVIFLIVAFIRGLGDKSSK